MLGNALRGHLAEFGMVERQGAVGLALLIAAVEDEAGDRVPSVARAALLPLVVQLHALREQVGEVEKRIEAWHRQSEVSQRLDGVPGIGPIIATALVATVADPSAFSSGRQLAAWLGLVPRQTSTGGKERLGQITKQGNPYLRRLLVIGASAVLRHAGKGSSPLLKWAEEIRRRKPPMLASVALANKLARIAWAVMGSETGYRAHATA
jgi:transposase